jgi:hypothetical protein
MMFVIYSKNTSFFQAAYFLGEVAGAEDCFQGGLRQAVYSPKSKAFLPFCTIHLALHPAAAP